MIIAPNQFIARAPEILRGTYLDMWIENEVLLCAYKTKEVNLHVAIRATEERISFGGTINRPVICDYRTVENTTREARKYFVSERPSSYINAMGVIINTVAGELVLNFFIKIDKPRFPMKAFSNVHSAFDWTALYKSTINNPVISL